MSDPKKPKVLTRLRIDEVSMVDRGAGANCKVVISKRDDGPDYHDLLTGRTTCAELYGFDKRASADGDEHAPAEWLAIAKSNPPEDSTMPINLSDAEAEAEASKVADEVTQVAGIMREQGAVADKALRQFIKASNCIRECIMELQQRGVNSPNGAQMLALGARAIKRAFVESPFAKEFEHVSSAQAPHSFARFTSSWASAIERNVGKHNKEDAA